jgi:hypothetical protein
MKKITILLGVLLISVSSFSSEIHFSMEGISVKNSIEETWKKEDESGLSVISKLRFGIREVLSIPFIDPKNKYDGRTHVGEGMDEGEH